jgi:hypothetical protein
MLDYHMVGTLDYRFKATGIIVVACIMMMASGAAQQAQIPVLSQGSSSRVLFLEHYMLANGTVVEGTSPFKSVNFPTYWYNENTKQLNGQVDFPINDSLIMIFGDVLTLHGNFGGGTGNMLFGVYSLPVTADQAVIYSIDMSGNVVMNVNKKTFVLRPGESYSYTENETLKESNAVIKVQYNHTYVNHGFIDKRRIGTGLVSRG